jgi:hypothetical protein
MARALKKREKRESKLEVSSSKTGDLPLLGAYNFSSKQFDENSMHVLNFGLKFVVADKFKLEVQLENEIEKFARSIRLRAMFGDSRMDRNVEFYVANPTFQPPKANGDIEAFIKDIESAMKECFANEKEIVANIPSNMSKSQLTALSKLKKDKDIVIKPADKNLGLVHHGQIMVH